MRTKINKLVCSILLYFGILCLGSKLTVNASTSPVTSSVCEDFEWTYEYTMIDYGYELLTSATYHGEKYTISI